MEIGIKIIAQKIEETKKKQKNKEIKKQKKQKMLEKTTYILSTFENILQWSHSHIFYLEMKYY